MGVRDLSVRLRQKFSHRKRVLNVMEDTMLSGMYRRQRRNRRLLKWRFKAKVKRSMKRYTSELRPENFLVLLLAWTVASDTASLGGQTWMLNGV